MAADRTFKERRMNRKRPKRMAYTCTNVRSCSFTFAACYNILEYPCIPSCGITKIPEPILLLARQSRSGFDPRRGRENISLTISKSVPAKIMHTHA